MLLKATRTKNLSTYSYTNILLNNVANFFHCFYVFALPLGPIWFLHGFYSVAALLMLAWYIRYEKGVAKKSSPKCLQRIRGQRN